MTAWMTIRVLLLGRPGVVLDPPPGRVLLVHSDHTFADLSEAVDLSFGRWDLSPAHEFAVEGRRLTSEPDAGLAEDTEEVTIGDVGLRAGASFTYVFDPEEQWEHQCQVEASGVDPVEEYGQAPSAPVPVYGWGLIPDQYGRMTEDDEEDEDGGRLPEWDGGHADGATWSLVAGALADVDRPRDDAALAASAAQLRSLADSDDWPYDVLWAAAGLDDDEWPEDDEELWLTLAAGVVAPRGALPLDADTESAWAAVESPDLAAAVVELVRAGVGQQVDPPTLLRLIERCPEVEAAPLGPEDEGAILAGLEIVVELWAVLGIVEDGTLSALGRWGLPESLRAAWTPDR